MADEDPTRLSPEETQSISPETPVEEEVPYVPPGPLKSAIRIAIAIIILVFMFLFLDYVFGFMKGN